MGLLDILGIAGSRRGGMSPLTMALMGVLAYRTMKGKGRLADVLGMNSASDKSDTAGDMSGLGGLLAGGGLGTMLSGGLGDLLKRFQENGEGDKAQSWVSTGSNQPIAPNELEKALGQDRVRWLLEQTGMSKDELLTGLSAQLPQVVDKLTPQGRLPNPNEADRLV